MMDANANKQETKKVKDGITAEIVNYKGILARQLTTGIWKAPAPSYHNKLIERKAIEAVITSING